MRLIARYSPNKAVIGRLTVWRRLALAGICILVARAHGGPFITGGALFIGVIAFCSALDAAYIKIRTMAWPSSKSRFY
jgi:hypothetical protein